MRLAVLADIHGNVLALEAVIADMAGRAVDRVINLGDCVSGPLWPCETLDLLRRHDWPTIRGNHDRWVGEAVSEPEGKSDAHAWRALDQAGRAWLGALPATLDLGHGVHAFHGRPGSDIEYLIEDIENGRLARAPLACIANRVGDIDARVLLCGHSHQPSITTLEDGRLILNPGSVGCPAYDDEDHVSETGSPMSRYAILDLPEQGPPRVEMLAIPYDHESAAKEAAHNGRPEWAHALMTGVMPTR
ncbi:metallophosphoesterase family protein [Flaviflagellibacter deserti]|uniref:Metallophosphoesterase family protein n=1 Tax=Flaviflagellibacter deserti TaxID=2267266 RepID=A0ABV9YYI1_9HYPH